MTRISTEEVSKRLESGQAAVFDVRGDVEFERAHIPGAKTAPLGSLVFRVARLMHPDSFVAVYSAGKDCGLAARAAQRLENLRLRNVHCYEDGLEGWQAAGLPVVESVHARVHARGSVRECRPIVVDREHAYGGAFKETTLAVEGAGG
jgi:rhodanese-related sulfurtransferase